MAIHNIYFSIITRILIAICVGLPALWFARKALGKIARKHMSLHMSVLIENIILYAGCIFLSISILHDLGFHLSALLGAAGIVGIAVAFAAQTSVANIISGIFLLIERSCAIGDRVQCDSFTGTIESIDLISIKIRTSDNAFIRIPNEFFIKKVVINKTYYDTQAIIFSLSFSTDHEIKTVTNLIYDTILKNITPNNTLFLTEPKPKINLFRIYEDAVCCSIENHNTEKSLAVANTLKAELRIKIWTNNNTLDQARNLFVEQVHKKLHESKISATIKKI